MFFNRLKAKVAPCPHKFLLNFHTVPKKVRRTVIVDPLTGCIQTLDQIPSVFNSSFGRFRKKAVHSLSAAPVAGNQGSDVCFHLLKLRQCLLQIDILCGQLCQ